MCVFQNSLLPRILWPLQLYEVPLTMVEVLERKLTTLLKRWLGLPKSLSSAVLYGSTNVLKLPIHGLKEEVLVSWTREVYQFIESKDLKVRGAGIETWTGRKWITIKELAVAEERLR